MLDNDHFMKFFGTFIEINKNGKFKDIKSNRFYDAEEIFKKYRAVREAGMLPTDFTREEVEEMLDLIMKEWQKEHPVVKQIDLYSYLKNDIYNNPNFQVDSSFTEIKFKANGQNFYSNSNIDELMNEYKARWESDPVLSEFKIGSIEANIKKIAIECNNMTQNKIASDIAYDPKYVEHIDKFLRTYYNFFKISEDYEIFKTLMLHWMWQVKRKMTNQKVVWHIWINFFGPTGVGKSFFLKKFCQVFQNYYIETKISSIFDDTREIEKFTHKYIINFEELAVNRDKLLGDDQSSLTRDEISTLKAMITGEKRDTRIYGTQRQATNDLLASFMSSANDHLYNTIFDETSMRRYIDFTCKRDVAGTAEEQAELNKYLDKNIYLWKAIDESRENGYWDPKSEVGMKIAEIQSNYYPTRSNLIQFKKFYQFTFNPAVQPLEVYSIYSTFCKNAGAKPKTLMNFNAEVARRWPKLIGRDGLPHFTATLIGDSTTTILDGFLNKKVD